MKVIKRETPENGKEIIVEWRKREYRLPGNCIELLEAMTGASDIYWCGGPNCKEGDKVTEIIFYCGEYSKRFQFKAVHDWWALSAEDIANTLLQRARVVKKWIDTLPREEVFKTYDELELETNVKCDIDK